MIGNSAPFLLFFYCCVFFPVSFFASHCREIVPIPDTSLSRGGVFYLVALFLEFVVIFCPSFFSALLESLLPLRSPTSSFVSFPDGIRFG